MALEASRCLRTPTALSDVSPPPPAAPILTPPSLARSPAPAPRVVPCAHAAVRGRPPSAAPSRESSCPSHRSFLGQSANSRTAPLAHAAALTVPPFALMPSLSGRPARSHSHIASPSHIALPSLGPPFASRRPPSAVPLPRHSHGIRIRDPAERLSTRRSRTRTASHVTSPGPATRGALAYPATATPSPLAFRWHNTTEHVSTHGPSPRRSARRPPSPSLPPRPPRHNRPPCRAQTRPRIRARGARFASPSPGHTAAAALVLGDVERVSDAADANKDTEQGLPARAIYARRMSSWAGKQEVANEAPAHDVGTRPLLTPPPRRMHGGTSDLGRSSAAAPSRIRTSAIHPLAARARSPVPARAFSGPVERPVRPRVVPLALSPLALAAASPVAAPAAALSPPHLVPAARDTLLPFPASPAHATHIRSLRPSLCTPSPRRSASRRRSLHAVPHASSALGRTCPRIRDRCARAARALRPPLPRYSPLLDAAIDLDLTPSSTPLPILYMGSILRDVRGLPRRAALAAVSAGSASAGSHWRSVRRSQGPLVPVPSDLSLAPDSAMSSPSALRRQRRTPTPVYTMTLPTPYAQRPPPSHLRPLLLALNFVPAVETQYAHACLRYLATHTLRPPPTAAHRRRTALVAPRAAASCQASDHRAAFPGSSLGGGFRGAILGLERHTARGCVSSAARPQLRDSPTSGAPQPVPANRPRDHRKCPSAPRCPPARPAPQRCVFGGKSRRWTSTHSRELPRARDAHLAPSTPSALRRVRCLPVPASPRSFPPLASPVAPSAPLRSMRAPHLTSCMRRLPRLVPCPALEARDLDAFRFPRARPALRRVQCGKSPWRFADAARSRRAQICPSVLAPPRPFTRLAPLALASPCAPFSESRSAPGLVVRAALRSSEPGERSATCVWRHSSRSSRSGVCLRPRPYVQQSGLQSPPPGERSRRTAPLQSLNSATPIVRAASRAECWRVTSRDRAALHWAWDSSNGA
ncbi:hypothetical protein B0H15DRAFT_956445 [Mycena belliarum]|uniref:Uncharacterized protein n=1 Tax=Mycena belliarum TaxID=1033014 RepID=A0AAD6TPJ9_9AGAR|nr:hypothetical protein B0H15DRAFT_956445 [Mycena belliae]